MFSRLMNASMAVLLTQTAHSTLYPCHCSASAAVTAVTKWSIAAGPTPRYSSTSRRRIGAGSAGGEHVFRRSGTSAVPPTRPAEAEMERAVTAFADRPNGGLIATLSAFTAIHRELIIALAA